MKKFLQDLFDDRWTLIGMFVAWIVLEGFAREVVGWMILATIVFQLVVNLIKKKDEGKDGGAE